MDKGVLDRYKNAVDEYIKLFFSKEDFLNQKALYQFGFLNEKGQNENVPKTGKRIRSTLLLLTIDAITGNWKDAIPAAAALEIFHEATLLIDDWQDEDRTRRGRKSLWTLKSVGPKQAINIGFFLFSQSSIALASLSKEKFSKEAIEKITDLFEQVKINVIKGQQMDIAFEEKINISFDAYLTMIWLKTGISIQASILMGVMLAEVEKQYHKYFAAFGRSLGFLFQMQDDYLGVYGSLKKMGKPRDDIYHKKKSLPIVLALLQSNKDQKHVYQNRDVTKVKDMLKKFGIKSKTRNEIELIHKEFISEVSLVPDNTLTKKKDFIFLGDFFANRIK